MVIAENASNSKRVRTSKRILAALKQSHVTASGSAKGMCGRSSMITRLC
jgi:hypothetical protein